MMRENNISNNEQFDELEVFMNDSLEAYKAVHTVNDRAKRRRLFFR